MALVFPTAPEAVLAAIRPRGAGKASGATNAIREVGAVREVAVLPSVFAATGGYESPRAFTDGVAAALPMAVVVLAAGAVLALLTPGRVIVDPEREARMSPGGERVRSCSKPRECGSLSGNAPA